MLQLTVIDADHMILTTPDRLTPSVAQHIQEAFEKWKNDGGALIINECLVVDRHAITVDLDLSTFYDGAELNGGDGP